ncbi:MAG TPA: PA14 domain-containing protein [Planctomycetota bacterium]|nr:PA14 domain-containing protein [Planctomycetota bacterium]
MPHPLPAALTDLLRRFSARRRRLGAIAGFGDALAVAIAALAVIGAIDHLVRPGFAWRVASSAIAYGVVAAAIIARVIRPLLAREALAASARRVERAAGTRDERLISAVELTSAPEDGLGGWMVARTIALAAQEASALDESRLIDSRPARRALARGIAAAAVLALACLAPGVASLIGRAALPFAEIARPSSTAIEVTPGSAVLARGAPFAIGATITPAPASAHAELAWDDGRVEHVVLARDAAGRWRASLAAVTRDFTYHVVAGDGESARFDVAVGAPPELRRIAVTVRPPAYTSLPPYEHDGGDIALVAGGDLTIAVELAGTPAAAAALTLEDGAELALTIGDDGIARVGLAPTANTTYGLRVTGVNGLVAEPPQRWLVTVQPDLPPTANLVADGAQTGLVSVDETVLFLGMAEDDVGLKKLDLVVVDAAGAIDRRPLALDPAAREAAIAEAVELAAEDPDAGDGEVNVALEAVDLGGQKAASAPVTLSLAQGDAARAAAMGARLARELGAIDAQMEIVRAVPRQWSAIGRAMRADDTAALRGELLSLRNRMQAVAGAVGESGGRLGQEFQHSALEHTPTAVALGARFSDWAAAESATTRAAVAAASSASDAASFDAGRDLAERAVADLARLRQDLALLVARLESEGVVARAESSAARSQRATLILGGARGWRTSAAAGLHADYFADIALTGAPFVSGAAQLPWVGHAPLGRASDWSARLSGEVLIDVEGDWTFAAVSDDGVRLSVAGQALLPPTAWVQQQPTDHRGVIRLTAGWHPLVVEHFQGSGPQTLHLRFAPLGTEPADIPADHLRNVARAAAATARAMAALAPEQVAGAQGRIGREGAAVATVPDDIARIAQLAVDGAIAELAARGRTIATEIAAVAATIEQWQELELSANAARISGMVDLARQTRERLRHLAAEMARRQPPPDALAHARDLARRMQERATTVRDLPAGDERAKREIAAARVAAAQMPAALERARSEAARTADDAWGSLAARVRAIERWERIDVQASAAAADAQRELAATTLDKAAAERARVAAERLGQALAEASKEAESERRDRAAAAATAALEQARLLAEAQNRGDLVAAAKAHAALGEATRAIAAGERAHGERDLAQRLDGAVAGSASDTDPAAAQQALQAVAERDRRAQPSLADEGTAQLTRFADRLGAVEAPPAAAAEEPADAQRTATELAAEAQRHADVQERTADGLAVSAAALALEGERLRGDQLQQDRADAYQQLAADVRDAAERPGDLARDDVAALAERAAALEGARGDQAQRDEIAAARQRSGRTAEPQRADAADAAAREAREARSLDDLAAAVRAAAQEADKRDAARADLERAAGPPPAEDAAALAARADRIAALAARDEQLAADESRAREAFAKAETAVAQRLRDAKTATDAAAATAPPASAAVAQRLAQQLPAAAAAADDLAKRASEREPSASATTPGQAPTAPAGSNEQLAADARAHAEAIEHAAARPMAEAYREDLAQGRPEALAPVAKAGQELAAAAVAQREAADRFERALARRDRNRVELAQALAEAAAPQAPSGSEAAKAQRAADQSARAAAQATAAAAAQEEAAARRDAARQANAAQAQADAAQRAADALAAAQPSPSAAAEARRAAQAAANRAASATHARANADAIADSDPQSLADARAALTSGVAARHELRTATAGLAEQAQAVVGDLAERARRARATETGGEPIGTEATEGPAPGFARSPRLPQVSAQASAPGESASRAQDGKESSAETQPAGDAQSRDGTPSPGRPEGESESPTQAEAQSQGRSAGDQSQSQSQGTAGDQSESPGEAPGKGESQGGSQASAEASAAARDALGMVAGSPQDAAAWNRAGDRLNASAARMRVAAATSGRTARGRAQASAEAPIDAPAVAALPDGDPAKTAEWARLRDASRKRIGGDGVEAFSEEHQHAIRAYFKRLGDDK